MELVVPRVVAQVAEHAICCKRCTTASAQHRDAIFEIRRRTAEDHLAQDVVQQILGLRAVNVVCEAAIRDEAVALPLRVLIHRHTP